MENSPQHSSSLFSALANRLFCGQNALFRHLLQVLGVVIAVSTSFGTQAKEGFSADLTNAPQAVRHAWDATFALIYSEPTYFHDGSAFLIGKKVIDGELVLSFLTVNHNIGNCETQDKICPGLILIQNARMRETPTMMNFDTLEGLRFDTVAVHGIKDSDLAIVVTSMSLVDQRKIPEPLRLVKDCELQDGSPLYAVGYPDTKQRINSKSLPIVNGDEVVKRWSQGIYLGTWSFTNQSRPFLGATVDALPGLSGGPVLDEQGQVVSIVRKGREGGIYGGNEDLAHRDYQMLGPTCLQMKAIGANFGD